MTRRELMKLSQTELAKWCRNQGLGYGVDESKATLVDRLLKAHPEPEVPETPEAPEAPPPEEKGPEEPETPEPV